MSDLIRREDVLEVMGKDQWYFVKPREQIERIKAIPSADNSVALLPNGELLVDTEYADQTKSVRLMNLEGFTRIFYEPNVGRWIRITQDVGLRPHQYMCSECHRIIEYSSSESPRLLEIKYPYCHCGAKMERRTDEHTDKRD